MNEFGKNILRRITEAALFLASYWQIVVFVLIFAVVGMLVFRACNKPPKLDQQQITKAQKAIEKDDRKAMLEVLAESAVREQGIDSNIKAAEEATEKAKQDRSGKTNEELAKEIEALLNR